MKFANIQFLWVLWLIPLLIVFYVFSFKRKMHLIHKFVSDELKERLLESVSFTRQKIKMAFLLISILMLVLALIGPRWGFHWEEVKQRGVDIILALDVSKSMLAEDVSPNRLERAKREIIDLLNIVEGDRVGLVAFAGTSFLQTPLTLDYGAIRIFLDDLDTDLIPVPGTAIGEAIRKSMASFEKSEKEDNSKVVILITDGEDHVEDPVKVAEEAKNQNIKIYTIGIGKEGGAPIPDGKNGGFKKDRRGEMILTHLDETTLQKVALKTGGSYIRSVTGEMDLEKIYQNIKTEVQDKELKSGKRKRYEERFQWPLAVAIFLLLLEVFFSERRRERKKFKFLGLFILGTVLLSGNSFAFLGNSKTLDAYNSYQDGKYDEALKDYTDAGIQSPLDLNLKYNLASTYYKMEQFEEASKLYESLVNSASMPLKEKALYNLGNTYYKEGKLKEAVESYKLALQLDPKDEDAAHNLKFVQDEIKRRIEEMKKQQQQQQQQQQQNQENKSCDNPQKQDGQKQDQKNDQNKEQNKDEQKGKEGNQGESKEKEEKRGQEEENKGQQEEKEAKEEQAKAGKEDKDQKDQNKDEKGAAAARASKGNDKDDKEKMSEQEAERWFSTLEENRKKFLQKQMQGNRRYSTEKDW